MDSDGVVIFGPPQFRVTTEKDAVSQNNPEVRMLSTPWNQLEAGIAYAMEKPLLIMLQAHTAASSTFPAIRTPSP